MHAKDVLRELKAPFPAESIHWRVGATNKDKTKCIALAYITARDVMRRLDTVCGPYWQAEYPFEGCCRVGIKIDGEWLWRANGAGETDVEGEKGQFSDAFKRAAVLWGVGQYLYDLPNVWVPIVPHGRSYTLSERPRLPEWALPRKAAAQNISDQQAEQLMRAVVMAGANVDKLCAHYGVKELSALTKNDFADAMDKLKRKAQEGSA